MIANKDSLGNILTREQIEYFKDTKVTNDKNELIVCYHGSPNAGFRVFNPQKSKSQFGNYKFGNANVNYFTTDKDSASSYTEFKYDDGTVYEVYLDIKNPYIVDNKSEAQLKSFLNIKDDRVREKELRLFDTIFNKWKDKCLDYSDFRFVELNRDLRKLNLVLRPSEQYDSDTDPSDIDLFDLWYLGKNSFMGAEHIVKYQYYTDELFDDDMYEELRNDIVGEDPKDYLFTTDDIVRYVLVMNEEDGTNYDGIIVKDILDSTSMFSNIATDYITLKSSNQIKAITNKNPTYSDNIDETLTENIGSAQEPIKQCLLPEHLFIDYKSMFQSPIDKKLNESEILNDVEYDPELDGNHKLGTLYNNGDKYSELLVPNGALTEAYLTEASRNDLINKSKKGKAYKDQSKGKNRWERKKWSSVASTTREYNSIDMNAFFKKDILTINIPVQGETNKYNVRIRFSGALREIQNAVKRNNNKLDYKSISQALIRTFNGENVYVYCNCPDFVYRMNWYSKQNGFDAAKPREQAPYQNRFAWTNRYDDMGGICKHIALVISNTFWLMKVASVINNYIHYAEQFMQRQFAELIFPKIYGVKYPQAVQLGLFDRKYLKHSKGVIDEINNYGKNRTKFKKEPKPQQTEPEFAVHPKQLSIFDDEIKQNSTPYKKQTIFDMGVEEVEDDVSTKPTFKKAKSSQPVMNKGFKQLSIFDEEEEN